MAENKISNNENDVFHDVPLDESIRYQPVFQALHKAQMLVSYAAEQGIALEKNDLQVFTKFKHLVRNNTWSTDEEADFWIAYSNIAKTLDDVNIKEIEAITVDSNPKGWFEKLFKIRWSPAQKIAKQYTMSALFFVVIMLILQVYSLIGNSLLSEAEEIRIKTKTLQTHRYDIVQKIIKSGNSYAFTFHETIKNDSIEKNEDDAELKQMRFDIRADNYNLWINYLALTNVALNINDWLFYNVIGYKELEKFYNTPDSVQKKYGFYIQTLYMAPEEAMVELFDTIDAILLAAKTPLDVLNLYLLPLLYGLLGAFAYVLRNLNEQLESINYSRDSNTRFLLRLFLGALLGLTVRVFFDSESTTELSSYSPLAVSFISGYSVEFFFSFLDGLIKRIIGNQTENTNSKAKVEK